MLGLKQFEVLTFDCYGTLIDWETGILGAMKPILSVHGKSLDDREILKWYGRFEAEAEEGEYVTYREVLKRIVESFGKQLGFSPTEAELNALPASSKNWPLFPDTVESLQKLKKRFKLAVISNTDDGLFAETQKHLKVNFDWIITAEQAKSYKPSVNNFQFATRKLGIPKEKILHVAQSVYHDVIPAKRLGLATVLVKRRGAGATLPAEGKPDLEVPDLQTLAGLL